MLPRDLSKLHCILILLNLVFPKILKLLNDVVNAKDARQDMNLRKAGYSIFFFLLFLIPSSLAAELCVENEVCPTNEAQICRNNT